MSGNLNERVARNEENIEDLDRRVEIVEKDNKSLSRLTALFEQQIKASEEETKLQRKHIDKQYEVLREISASLTAINHTQKEMKNDFSEVKSRVGRLEENGKIDIDKLIKRVVWVVVPSIITAIIMYYTKLK